MLHNPPPQKKEKKENRYAGFMIASGVNLVSILNDFHPHNSDAVSVSFCSELQQQNRVE
jgi:hypothetical protein